MKTFIKYLVTNASIGLFGFLIAFTLSATSAAPTGNPPSSNVSPNFNELSAGKLKIDSNGSITTEGILRLGTKDGQGRYPTSLDSLGIVAGVANVREIRNAEDQIFYGNGPNKNPVVIKDDLTVLGRIASPRKAYGVFGNGVDDKVYIDGDAHIEGKLTSKNFGNFYIKEWVTSNFSGWASGTATCTAGDIRVGCSAYANNSRGIDFSGAKPTGTNSCFTDFYNDTGGQARKVTVYAYCLSSN